MFLFAIDFDTKTWNTGFSAFALELNKVFEIENIDFDQ